MRRIRSQLLNVRGRSRSSQADFHSVVTPIFPLRVCPGAAATAPNMTPSNIAPTAIGNFIRYLHGLKYVYLICSLIAVTAGVLVEENQESESVRQEWRRCSQRLPRAALPP